MRAPEAISGAIGRSWMTSQTGSATLTGCTSAARPPRLAASPIRVAIMGTAIQVSASTLGNAVAALAEPLQTCVNFIDGMRLQPDGLTKSATVAINGESWAEI